MEKTTFEQALMSSRDSKSQQGEERQQRLDSARTRIRSRGRVESREHRRTSLRQRRERGQGESGKRGGSRTQMTRFAPSPFLACPNLICFGRPNPRTPLRRQLPGEESMGDGHLCPVDPRGLQAHRGPETRFPFGGDPRPAPVKRGGKSLLNWYSDRVRLVPMGPAAAAQTRNS